MSSKKVPMTQDVVEASNGLPISLATKKYFYHHKRIYLFTDEARRFFHKKLMQLAARARGNRRKRARTSAAKSTKFGARTYSGLLGLLPELKVLQPFSPNSHIGVYTDYNNIPKKGCPMQIRITFAFHKCGREDQILDIVSALHSYFLSQQTFIFSPAGLSRPYVPFVTAKFVTGGADAWSKGTDRVYMNADAQRKWTEARKISDPRILDKILNFALEEPFGLIGSPEAADSTSRLFKLMSTELSQNPNRASIPKTNPLPTGTLIGLAGGEMRSLKPASTHSQNEDPRVIYPIAYITRPLGNELCGNRIRAVIQPSQQQPSKVYGQNRILVPDTMKHIFKPATGAVSRRISRRSLQVMPNEVPQRGEEPSLMASGDF